MLASRPPFSSIQLALVSHSHREHFQATIAGTFLKNHTKTILVPSPEIIQAIRDQYADYPAIKGQLKAVEPNKGEMTSFTLFGIQVDFILFSHEASAFYTEQVMGHIIHLGGRKLFYLGDAEMRPDNWQPYDLKSQGIHIALIPFWLFKAKLNLQSEFSVAIQPPFACFSLQKFTFSLPVGLWGEHFMKTIYLIDASVYVFRAYFSLSNSGRVFAVT